MREKYDNLRELSKYERYATNDINNYCSMIHEKVLK